MNLRYILGISFLLASGLPLLVFWLWPLSAALEAELDRAHERHLVLAQAAAETLEVYQENVGATFDTIVESVRSGADLSHARPLLETQAFTHFCVLDATTGKVLQSFSVTGAAMPDRVPDDLLTELVRRVDQRLPHLGEVWRGKEGNPQFLLVEKLGDKLVFASVTGAFLKRIADSVVFGQSGHMAIIDANGRLIAHPDPAWVASMKDVSVVEEIAAMMKRDTPEVLVFRSPALNEDVVAGAAPVGDSNWRVLVPQPVSEVRATIIAGRKSASLVFSAGLALSALVAMAAAALISRPLKAVAAAADQMARGVDGVVVGKLPPGAPSEVVALRTAFNKMARRIQSTLARITLLAGQDPTTGLLNKRAFEEAAQTWLRTAQKDKHFNLLHVDMDNLKRINDVYGHAAGDEAIRGIALSLQSAFPAPALVGRVGGDEFLVLAPGDGPDCVRRRLGPLIDGQVLALSGEQSTSVSCSVGLTNTRPGGFKVDLLINQADEAMYYAKKRASGLQVYDQEMRSRTHRRLELSSLLRQDVAADRIEVVFQPIFCAMSGDTVAFEALARWKTAQHGVIHPGEFLAVAQQTGILSDLDRRVRQRAFAFVRDLRMRASDIPVAINVTAADLARADFASRFHDDLKVTGLTGSDVIVEVTETIFHDPCGLAIRTLAQLTDADVAIQLDDFGKGFSSHGLLPLCNFQAVKIDLHFAGSPSRDSRAGAIVGSLARLGAELGLAVTLEGIETEEDRAFADALGVDRVQGYLYAHPLDRAQALAAAHRIRRFSATG